MTHTSHLFPLLVEAPMMGSGTLEESPKDAAKEPSVNGDAIWPKGNGTARKLDSAIAIRGDIHSSTAYLGGKVTSGIIHADKLGVFKAVVAEAYTEMAAYIAAQIQPLEDPWAELIVGCQAFLEVAQREDVRRLVFIEAPAVLAAETLVEFDQYGFGLLHEAIQVVVSTGQLTTIDAEGFAHLVNGALNELAAWVAQSDDPQRLKTAQELVETLLLRHQGDGQ